MKKVLFLIAAVIISISGLKAQKEKGTWNSIGETTVDFKNPKAIITVAGDNNFKALRIKATDAPVHIDNLIVVYTDGEPENIPVRFDFRAGAESRAITLEGAKRRIKEIDILYKNVPNSKNDKATVEIEGLK